MDHPYSDCSASRRKEFVNLKYFEAHLRCKGLRFWGLGLRVFALGVPGFRAFGVLELGVQRFPV